MARKKKRKKPAPQPADSCLIISPFGEWFDEYNDLIYKPAIVKAGLRSVRADDLYKTGSIVNDIWELTKTAKILLADLSGKNPNVFYELGLAHAIAKPVVLITDNIDDIPFDLRTLRVIPYDKNSGDWGEDLRKSITTAIKETLSQPGTSILATFLHSQPAASVKRIPSEEKKVLELRQEIDSLRNQMASLSSVKRIVSPRLIEGELRHYRKRNYPMSLAIDRVISRGGAPYSITRDIAEHIWRGRK